MVSPFSLVSVAEAARVDPVAFGKVLDPVISNIVNPIVMLMFAVAVLVFTYGAVQVIWRKYDAEAHKRGRNAMLMGLLGMLIMVSAWGIINLISNTVKDFQ